jgi:hypothetical protein
MAPQKGGKPSKGTVYQQLGSFIKNKRSKIEKHVKKFPNDVKAAQALTVVGSANIRKKPKNKLGWLQSNATVTSYIRSNIPTVTKDVANGIAQTIKFVTKVENVHKSELKKGMK